MPAPKILIRGGLVGTWQQPTVRYNALLYTVSMSYPTTAEVNNGQGGLKNRADQRIRVQPASLFPSSAWIYRTEKIVNSPTPIDLVEQIASTYHGASVKPDAVLITSSVGSTWVKNQLCERDVPVDEATLTAVL